MRKVSLAIYLASMLCACSNKENSVPSSSEMSAVRARLVFTCTHEPDHLPPLDPTADLLFKYLAICLHRWTEHRISRSRCVSVRWTKDLVMQPVP